MREEVVEWQKRRTELLRWLCGTHEGGEDAETAREESESREEEDSIRQVEER